MPWFSRSGCILIHVHIIVWEFYELRMQASSGHINRFNCKENTYLWGSWWAFLSWRTVLLRACTEALVVRIWACVMEHCIGPVFIHYKPQNFDMEKFWQALSFKYLTENNWTGGPVRVSINPWFINLQYTDYTYIHTCTHTIPIYKYRYFIISIYYAYRQ